MSSLPLGRASGLPSDKLVAPMNAPAAGALATGVQAGVSGQVVLAQYVVIFGTTGGMFVYAGSPGPGNAPIYSISNADADPYGNVIEPGIWAGRPGNIQVGIQASGGIAYIFFVPVGSYAGDAIMGMLQSGGQAILQIAGAQTEANPAVNSDYVIIDLYDHGSAGPDGSAAVDALYFDSTGNPHFLFQGNYQGMYLPAVNTLAAVEPGTGTSSSNVAVAETFHNITVDAGWTIVIQPQYRLIPGVGVQVIGLITHAATAAQTDINASHPVGPGYLPSTTRYYRTPMPAPDLAGSVQVSSAGVFTMRASGFNATQAILDGIYAL